MTRNNMTEEEIWDEINHAFERMTIPQRKLWDTIRITPKKWIQHPYGDLVNGFWVVAIYGRQIVWYNETEEGFNRSRYEKYGEFAEYFCNQDELEWTIQNISNEIKDGYPDGMYAGPPGTVYMRILKCNECGSDYYADTSKMNSLCPECAHSLYGYSNCEHKFKNGRCVNCYWDGSKSDFLNRMKEEDAP